MRTGGGLRLVGSGPAPARATAPAMLAGAVVLGG